MNKKYTSVKSHLHVMNKSQKGQNKTTNESNRREKKIS